MINEAARELLKAYRERHPERAGQPTPYEFRLKLLLTQDDLDFLAACCISLGTDAL